MSFIDKYTFHTSYKGWKLVEEREIDESRKLFILPIRDGNLYMRQLGLAQKDFSYFL